MRILSSFHLRCGKHPKEFEMSLIKLSTKKQDLRSIWEKWGILMSQKTSWRHIDIQSRRRSRSKWREANCMKSSKRWKWESPCSFIPKSQTPHQLLHGLSFLSFHLLQVTKSSSTLSVCYLTRCREVGSSVLFWTVLPLKHHKSLAVLQVLGLLFVSRFEQQLIHRYSLVLAWRCPLRTEMKSWETLPHMPIGNTTTRKCFPHGLGAYVQSWGVSHCSVCPGGRREGIEWKPEVREHF